MNVRIHRLSLSKFVVTAMKHVWSKIIQDEIQNYVWIIITGMMYPEFRN